MSETKGKLHRHDLSIHIEREIDGVTKEHICIANMNDMKHVDNEANAERFLKCWNSHDDLLAACKAAQYVYDFTICRTPTGKDRERLTEKNILRLQAVAEAEKV